MLRRFSLLAVLLLTLAGIAPALACNSDDSCCPPEGAPCGQAAIQAVVCCLQQPTHAAITAAARELELLEVRLPYGPVPAAVVQPAKRDPTYCLLPQAPPTPPDQQQLYLQTGRLRL